MALSMDENKSYVYCTFDSETEYMSPVFYYAAGTSIQYISKGTGNDGNAWIVKFS